MSKIKSGNHTIELSRPGKVLFPDDDITKKDLVDYYRKMAGQLLPFLKNRPLVMHRYPDGIFESSFYQKEVPDYFPEWIDTVEIDLRGNGKSSMVMCNNEATLLYLASQASITPHIWLSTSDNPEKPDRIVFDLDPPEDGFELVQNAAKDLKQLFDRMEMHCYAMTTGSEGMHVLVMLDGAADFDDARKFAHMVAERLVGMNPDTYTTETRKDKRRGRLFIDYLRNAYGQTTVAPYAVRARKGAPVATPIDWNEAGKGDMSAQKYHIGNIFRRLSARDDPWSHINKHRYSVSTALKKLENDNS